MKKTLLITLDYYPNIGGIANYWKCLGDCMPQEQWLVYHHRSGHWLSLFWKLPGLLRKERIEHIIVGQILPIGTVVMMLSRFFDIPYSVSLHGMDIASPLSHHRKKMLCKKILQNASTIIVNSAYTKSVVQKYGSFECITIYPCPSITPERYPDLSMPVNFPKGKKVIVTVSRLVKRKGHEDVLLAMKILSHSKRDLVYAILGDGSYREKLESDVHGLGLESSVLFLGTLPDWQVAQWYANCTAALMVSKELAGDVEGFGITYLEANSFGKPVIAGRSGGVEEAVLDLQTGLVVSPGRPEEIVRAIEKIFTASEIANRLGTQGKARVEREFNWSEQAKKLECMLH